MFKTYLNWSSGKDAALALYLLQNNKEYTIEKLVTTVNSEVDRVSMHGLRKDLLIQQAQSLEIPLQLIELDGTVSMEEYNSVMKKSVSQLVVEGFTHSVFGDIFLEDLKKYREEQLETVGITAVFPLWKKDTKELILEFIKLGFKAITVCINAKVLDKSFCGREIDLEFIESLPANVDPCGENGEFHTFVYDGPNFKEPVKFEVGEIIERTYTASKSDKDCFKDKPQSWDTAFWYCDLIPK
jgi:uncharacterized protein (TIGR00290 family)